MISLAALFLFGWFFFKSVGLAFRVAWCAAKVAAAVLFVVALPLMVVGLLIGSIIKLALPLLLIAAAFYFLKSCAEPHKRHRCVAVNGIHGGVFAYTVLNFSPPRGCSAQTPAGGTGGRHSRPCR